MSKKEDNNVNEPLSGYSKHVTFDEVWQMFKVTNEQFHETEKQFKEIAKQSKETDKKFAETDKKIDKLAKLYGGVSENSRDVAEEFFRRGLEGKKDLFGIPFDQVAHLEKRTKKLQGEYDIVLYNGDVMIVIEVKYKLHPDDVEDFIKRKLPNFKPLFSEYKDKKIIGGVAAMSVPNHSRELALKNGLLLLTQSGDNIAVANPKRFVPRYF